MKLCGIKDCNLPVLALGLCNKHWQRNRKYGSPMATKSHSGAMKGLSAKERFDLQVKPTDGCWIWAAATDKDGYGRFRGIYEGTVHTRAHRYSWELHNRQHIPPGMFVCHKCDNPRCVNPDHLFLGTPKENTQDMIAKDRRRNPKGEQVKKAILKENDVLLILADARPYAQIAADYGVAATTIGSIKARQSWSHLEVDHIAKARRVGPRKGKGLKVTEEIVREILASSLPGKDLAMKFGISRQLVCNIKARRSWAHVI